MNKASPPLSHKDCGSVKATSTTTAPRSGRQTPNRFQTILRAKRRLEKAEETCMGFRMLVPEIEVLLPTPGADKKHPSSPRPGAIFAEPSF